MHTVSTHVKGGLGARRSKAEQGQATRAEILRAARALFGTNGYSATSTEEIVAAAGVTKGALYHHFGGKPDLFRAVFEEVKHEISDRVAAIFMEPDAWTALSGGCQALVDAQLDPAVRQIVLNDARSVLGWETVREVDNRFGAVALRGALRKAMNAGVIERAPLRPLGCSSPCSRRSARLLMSPRGAEADDLADRLVGDAEEPAEGVVEADDECDRQPDHERERGEHEEM
jgi:AcrR family transcriptional regulator